MHHWINYCGINIIIILYPYFYDNGHSLDINRFYDLLSVVSMKRLAVISEAVNANSRCMMYPFLS